MWIHRFKANVVLPMSLSLVLRFHILRVDCVEGVVLRLLHDLRVGLRLLVVLPNSILLEGTMPSDNRRVIGLVS